MFACGQNLHLLLRLLPLFVSFFLFVTSPFRLLPSSPSSSPSSPASLPFPSLLFSSHLVSSLLFSSLLVSSRLLSSLLSSPLLFSSLLFASLLFSSLRFSSLLSLLLFISFWFSFFAGFFSAVWGSTRWIGWPGTCFWIAGCSSCDFYKQSKESVSVTLNSRLLLQPWLVPQNRGTSQDPKQEASDKAPRARGLGCKRFNLIQLQLLQVNKFSILKHLDNVQTIDWTGSHNHKEIDRALGIKSLACVKYGRTSPLKWSMQKIAR